MSWTQLALYLTLSPLKSRSRLRCRLILASVQPGDYLKSFLVCLLRLPAHLILGYILWFDDKVAALS
jgi:hypothetical protein